MPTVQLPYNFTPRPYQIPPLQAFEQGKKRLVMVDHRRTGKDKLCVNIVAREMFKRVGAYYYFFPTYQQGRKVLWDGKDKDGFPFLGHFPKELRAGDPNNTEMKLWFKHPNIPDAQGSLFQVVGSDNIDSIMGSNPVGCVFSEYALQDPKGWDFIRPILRENGGWAIFPYTPRGKNHGYTLYQMAKEESKRPGSEWYCELLTIEDTYGKGGTVGPEDVEQERRAGMSENLIRQEFFCDFDAAVENAVFGEQVFAARNEKRVRNVPWDPKIDVETYWDIGWDDATAIWFVQQVRPEVRLIDYYEARLAGPEHYVKVLREKPYKYGRHVMPHDADYGRIETGGKSLKALMQEMGVFVDIAKKLSKEEQIQNARLLFPRCYWDEGKAGKGFDALASWHFEYDSEKKVMGRTPRHDWSSHGADAFCLIGSELREAVKAMKIKYPSLGLA